MSAPWCSSSGTANWTVIDWQRCTVLFYMSEIQQIWKCRWEYSLIPYVSGHLLIQCERVCWVPYRTKIKACSLLSSNICIVVAPRSWPGWPQHASSLMGIMVLVLKILFDWALSCRWKGFIGLDCSRVFHLNTSFKYRTVTNSPFFDFHRLFSGFLRTCQHVIHLTPYRNLSLVGVFLHCVLNYTLHIFA